MYFNGRESGPDFNFNRDICKGVEEYNVNVVDFASFYAITFMQ